MPKDRPPSPGAPALEETEVYPADGPTTGGPPSEIEMGTRIGPYRILQQIARGGMGTVYLADREDHFKQRVALKVIQPDKTNDAVLQHFYAERQILADLDHPHIARIFDGGATRGTLPFFVMEYVEGEPFDLACSSLPLRQRLELFQKVCGAVHHAHRSLIVHRDLKPSNILVTAKGEPKLLDFGIAMLLDRSHGERKTTKLRHDPGPMTLAFASPEQLKGEAITIATDIYSLGVLLYSVLSGRHPHRTPDISRLSLIQAICHEDPAPPSQVANAEDARRLTGDLDAIVLKTLSKRPEDRYDSAAQLAEEIQLHLDDFPIRAWRGSWFDRLRKGVRRNKLASAAAVFLLIFSLTVTVLWRHAVQQRARAEQAQIRAERTQGFILDFFKGVEPDRSAGPAIDVKKILDSGRQSLENSLYDEPQTRADLLGTLATIYHALALYDDALVLQEQAVELRRKTQPLDKGKMAVDINNLGNIYYALEQYKKAEELLRESLPLWRELDDPYELNVLGSLGATLIWQNKITEALAIYEMALARSEALALKDHPKTATIYYGLGATHKRLGAYVEAEPHLRRALRAYARDSEAKPSRIAQVQSSLGEVLHNLGRHQEARPFLEEALATREQLFGNDHLKTASSKKKLARLLLELEDLEAAGPLLQQAGDTYSNLQHEAGVAEIREAQGRLSELSRRGASQVEATMVVSTSGL